MKISKSTKKIIENIIKNSEQIVLKKYTNQNISNVIKKVIQKNKELLKIFLNSMMIFATIQKDIKKHYEKIKKIITNASILLIKELSNEEKQHNHKWQNDWKIFQKTPLDEKINLNLKKHLNGINYENQDLNLINLLGYSFQNIEKVLEQKSKSKNIEMAFQIGNYVGAVYLIHHLEQKLPKVLFLLKEKRKKRIWLQREKLFFLKITFVEKYNEYLRQIRPLNFNLFIRKFNYMLQ